MDHLPRRVPWKLRPVSAMRVLLVHPRLDVRGGAENLVQWLARGLAERGHRVEVATRLFAATPWSPGAWEGILMHRIDARRRRFETRMGHARRCAGQVGALAARFDLVVAHNFPANVWATLRRPASRTRTIWYCHEPAAQLHWETTQPTLGSAVDDPGRRPAWTLRAFRKHLAHLESRRRHGLAIDRRLDGEAAAGFDAILANSAFTARMVARIYGRVAAPCRPGAPIPKALAPLRGVPPFAAWVASTSPPKNALVTLEALRIAVCERGARDLCVRVSGLATPEYRRLVDKLGIAANVVLEPWLDDAALHALLAGARLVLYPSVDEPFGLVPLEAMAHGRPVVASNQGGPSESIVAGVTGLLVDPLDAAAVADALLELWTDPRRAARLGAAGRQRFEEHFSIGGFLDRFEALACAG